MKNKMITGIMIAAAMTAAVAGTAMAEENEKVESKGLVFEIPGAYRDLLTVQTEDLDEDTLIRVSETASIEAAQASGEEYEGAGWLFDIVRVPEEELEQMRCETMDGKEVFAKDGDVFYLFCHPTDVRLIREQYDNIEEDLEQWGELNEWASGEMRNDILRDNPQLEAKTYTNTSLDMYLARAAFQGNYDFEVRCLEYDTMDPAGLDDNSFLEDLTEGVTFEYADGQEAPDGEYYVLYFNEDDVRYDFFQLEGGENLIREVHQVGDEEMEILYRAVFEDAGKTSTGIMREWIKALAAAHAFK